ncbi:MAG TPA: aldehyde dehydrogenase family protein [Thermodesulfobacteriota bacterium]|nr:aldehyde dehydrogenase family protein [Thermodesulfobacteriota bacterium]
MIKEAKNIICGDHVAGSSGDVKERYNPATGELISKFVESTSEDVNKAVISARRAFEKSSWSRDPKFRVHVLRRIYEAIIQNLGHLARVQTLENGKIIRDSRSELNSAADLFDYYSGLVRDISGRTHLLNPNTMSFVIREPIGVVGIIAPWNSPVVLLARSLAPALAAGNTVTIKPASYTPLTVYEFLNTILQNVKDLPKGVINLVLGSGKIAGNELVRNKDVDFISFTGSTEAGRMIMREASVNIKRLSLELGGKTPNIILEDADFESAIRGAINGSMLGSAGQICFAGTRVIIHDKIYKEFKENVTKVIPKLKIGNGLNEEVDVGPVSSKSQLKTVMSYIEEGKKVANLLVGGNQLSYGEYLTGHFVEPTVFDDVPSDSKIAQEEIFGPVISLIRASSLEEIVSLANNTKYGLSAAIWTNNLTNAFELARKIKAGVVWINMFGKMFSEAETGKYKQSGIGALRGIEALNTFTEIKDILINI